ncbi:MAG: hypothetical protein ACM3S2_06405, partial [Ignavibacteriales bacterium]
MNRFFPAIVRIIFVMIFCGAAVYPQTSEKNSPVIAFVSDTQEPMMIEKLWLKGDNNELASREIFRAINKEQ